MLAKTIKTLLRETLGDMDATVFYHGTSSILPFQTFDESMIGSGVVSHGSKHNGFFFTSEFENAEYYAKYFVCKVKIDGLETVNSEGVSPSRVMDSAYSGGRNLLIKDILDGGVYSDVAVVPKNNLRTIHILEWVFVGDKESLYERWDEIFHDRSKESIDETLDMLDIDVEWLLGVDVFREYYDMAGF